MKLKKVEVTKFWTTPKKLRAIADFLENQFKAALVGDEVPKVVREDYLAGIELWFVADQEEINRGE